MKASKRRITYDIDDLQVFKSTNYFHCSFSWGSATQEGVYHVFFLSVASYETDYRKALLLAHQNLQDARFKLIVDCLCGILFLRTPHVSVTDEDILLCHNQVLYSCVKIAVQKRSSRLSASDVFQLANLAATFEQIANVPVLSVFEYADRRFNMQKIFDAKKKARKRINSLIIFSLIAGSR